MFMRRAGARSSSVAAARAGSGALSVMVWTAVVTLVACLLASLYPRTGAWFNCLMWGYLIGALPFGYVIVKLAKGVDIREVGSGNVGATNVGRFLGFRYFLLCFTLDIFKGFLPTWGLPRLVEWSTSEATGSTLPVLVALAAVIGHNYPIYLEFKGGKGVATSLGVLLALAAVPSLFTVVAFVLFLLVTKFVSLSSVLSSLVFVGVYFSQEADPWSADHLALSLLALGLMVMLIFRHRGNLKRIAQGTEPKVMFKRPARVSVDAAAEVRSTESTSGEEAGGAARSGRVSMGVLVWVAMATSGIAAASLVAVRLGMHAGSAAVLDCGSYRLTTETSFATGYQRAERVLFLDSGRWLVVLCPRYQRLLVYQREQGSEAASPKEIELQGRPLALASCPEGFAVLEQPPGDEKHLRPGWISVFRANGESLGRFEIGHYPRDMKILPGERRAVVTLAGSSEGGEKHPAPSLRVIDWTEDFQVGVRGRSEFSSPRDDPVRLALTPDGKAAAVALGMTNRVVWLDLADPDQIITRASRQVTAPGPIAFVSNESLLVATQDHGLLRFDSPDAPPVALPIGDEVGEMIALDPSGSDWVVSLSRRSELAVLDPFAPRVKGRLKLKSTWNLGGIRPLGLAFDHDYGRIAIANRAGGSVHLVRVDTNRAPDVVARTDVDADTGGGED